VIIYTTHIKVNPVYSILLSELPIILLSPS